MKKFLAILLVLACIFSLAACSSEVPSGEATATTQPTTVHTDPTDAPTEAPTEAATEPTTIPTEPPTEAPTEKPTQAPTEKPTKPTDPAYDKDGDGMIDGYEPITPTERPTQKPTSAPATEPADDGHVHNYYKEGKDYTYCYEEGLNLLYCDCGAYRVVSGHPVQRHYMNIRTTIVKATHDKEGLDEVKCTKCPYTTTEVTPKVNVPYLVDVVLVTHERPNECYLSDGTPILERIYGKEYCQVGDTLTYRIIMSDGSTNGYTVRNWLDNVADVTVNGDLVTVKVTEMISANCFFHFGVESNDIDNNFISKSVSMDVVLGNCKFTDLSQPYLYVCLRNYITNNGMDSHLFLLNEFNSGDLVRYTKDDPCLSISGTAKYGYDDYLIINKYDDWLKTYFDLVDAYKARGFTKVYMDYQSGMSDGEGGYSDIIVFMAC